MSILVHCNSAPCRKSSKQENFSLLRKLSPALPLSLLTHQFALLFQRSKRLGHSPDFCGDFTLPRVWAFVLLAFGGLGFTPAFAATTICNAGDQIVLKAVLISQSCTVTGNLAIGPGGLIVADFTGSPNQTFAVAGNIKLTGNAQLQIVGGTLSILQDYNGQRQIQSFDTASLILRYAKVVVNQGAGNKNMAYNAFGNSQMIVFNSSLDSMSSWLFGSFFGQSRLIAIDSIKLPTEIYVKEGSTIQISGTKTNPGIWLDLVAGVSGTIDLPRQADGNGTLQAFSWSVGRNSQNLTGVSWQLDVSGAMPGLGVESHEGSKVMINGAGVPQNGELRISYDVESGTKTMSNLAIGLQNTALGNDQLILNNVQLGLVGWQIYAFQNAMLTITNSMLNEVGVGANGHVQVYDSIFQFAVTAAFGGNSTVDIYRSQIHSQAIETMGNGVVSIYDSAIYGASLVAHETTSKIRLYNGALLQNADGACPFSPQIMDPWGVPRCNPFIAQGGTVSKAGQGVFACTGTVNCNW